MRISFLFLAIVIFRGGEGRFVGGFGPLRAGNRKSGLGCNHVHLTERLGFVTQHLWLGDFGKCNRGIRARSLRLRYPKSSVTSPLS